ncbi:hypothetical protein GCM10027049_29280 [Mucilaginibacter puniceus]
MESIKYTHIAKLYGFKCYFNEETMDVKGTTWLNDKLIDLFIWIENIYTVNEGFMIQIIEPINSKHIINRVR